MKKFKKNKYVVIREAIQPDFALFLYNYFLIKKQVYDTCLQTRYFSPFEQMFGYYETDKDQMPGTYSNYADVAMETLMLKCQPLMEKTTGLKLNPSYSYTRLYKKGDVLARHKDRFSCEISTTMNLGGDSWALCLEPSGKEGLKGIKVNLKPGDMLVYRGCELEHWREPFQGNVCVQVFLHYNNQDTPGAKDNMFDTKMHIGLPSYFKNA